MDISSVIGLILAAILILAGMAESITAFINYPSLLIVVGGTLGATMVFFPLENMLGMGGIVKTVFFPRSESPSTLIATIIDFAGRARREGLLSLQNVESETDYEFLVNGLNMVVDQIEPEVVETIMSNEIDYLEERHKTGADIFATMGALAPALGMIGTLIGLVLMLQNLEDTSKIGPNMSIALITTFYGALMANIVFIPFAGKLRLRSAQEVLLMRLTMEGVLAIGAGNNPRTVESKLNSFLAPKLRANLTG